MIKKTQIYKRDKWNMLNIEVHGRQIIVREISEQWGEEAHIFLSRPELMNWAEQRFAADQFEGTPEEREEILAKIRDV